jgi:tetratricopeptide (TPR) repeat protein
VSLPPSRALRGPLPWLAALHVGLALWALWAWIRGPFLGEGIIDGAEILSLARAGSAGPFETKSPLYPALLAAAFGVAGDSPWTVGALGIALSLAVLFGTARLCREIGRPDAASWGAGLYAISGSAFVYAVQPLPPMGATATLVWGTVAVAKAHGSDSPAYGALGGALVAASAFTRAPLALAGLLLVAWLVRARRWRVAGATCAGALAVILACFAGFGGRAWPAAASFNLRLGNGAERTGFSDVRLGPVYDRMRIEAAFAEPQARGAAPDFERFQRAALKAEVAADPLGALATLARKAYLFWFRTEIVSAADFRHGLARFPPARVLLLSFGLVAPLAIASLARSRAALVWLPLLAVFAADVVWLTCARYRFPALPFACAAAGIWIGSRPRARDWIAAGLCALLLNVNLSGRNLIVPGDGLVQEGRVWLARDRLAERALSAYRDALAAGSRDARGRYELALALEARAELEEAEQRYREALELDPLYPEAAENLVALMLRAGRASEAAAQAQTLAQRSPYAGGVWLNLAAARRALDPSADVRELEAEGFLRLSLRALSQGSIQQSRHLADEARTRGMEDARLP